MPKSKREKNRAAAIKMLRDTYDVIVDYRDIYMLSNQVFLSTKKAAEVFNTSYHNFSNAYVKHLKNAGTHSLIFGRNKYYSLTDILCILSVARTKGISIFEICKNLKKRLKKIAKKRQKGKK